MPERIQRKRQRGWRMPPGAVSVTRPGQWGNPFVVGEPSPVDGRLVRTNEEAVELYELHTGPMGNYELDVDEVRRKLAGKTLACWCPVGTPCHGDSLLRIANAEER